MEAISKTTIEVQLSLSDEEARRLMEMVQNPICEEETAADLDFRKRLFLVLKQQLNPDYL
jgi:hypothetical protein